MLKLRWWFHKVNVSSACLFLLDDRAEVCSVLFGDEHHLERL